MTKLLLVTLTLAVSATSFAATITQGGTPLAGSGLVSSVAGVTTINFNSGTAPSSGAISYVLPGANVVQGSLTAVYSSPLNDTTPYLTVGPTGNRTPVTINFNQAVDYFGFYASSLDPFNQIDFFSKGVKVVSLSGTQIAALGGFPASGDPNTGLYVNISASSAAEYFDQIILSSSSNAFETDNHAFHAVSGTFAPEPTSFLLMGPALAFIGFRLRRRK